MSKSPTTVSEYDPIAETVQRYVDGGKSGRGADMKAAFHPDATIFGYIGADLFAGPIQKLFDWNDQNGPATELQARLAGIDIEGTIATARLELDNWTGHKFTDMFTLLKVDGEWKIISKVFYLHPESFKEQRTVRMNFAARLFAACAIVVVFTVGAQAQQKPCLTASKFGPNDQIGNLNYVTPAKTLAASKLVTRGNAYRLGIETNKDTPAYPPRTFSITVLQPGQAAGATLGPTKTTYNDDIIMGWVGVGSQLDGFGHAGIDNLYFNCNRAPDFAMADGLKKLGVEKVPAIATRGVLLDMAGYFNTDLVKEGTAFNRAEIEGAMKRQGIQAIEKGDVVLFYTGWLKLLGKDNKRFGSVGPGLGREGAKYLASLEVAMVGTDTPNFEVVPFETGAGMYEVHQILLPLNGIHILENMNTEEMVKDKTWEFLFTLGPARITGGVQAIINPIAIR